MNTEVPDASGWAERPLASLRKILAVISGVWSVQHNDDGTHSTITASGSVTSAGLVSAVGNLYAQRGVTDYECEIGNLTSIPAEPVERGLRIAGTSGYEVIVRPVSSPGVSGDEVRAYHLARDTAAPIWRIVFDATDFAFMPYKGSLGGMKLGEDNTGDRFTEVNGLIVRAVTGYLERGRSVYVGEFATFTPTRTAGTGTWTGGTVQTMQDEITGKKLTVNFQVDASSNSNATATVKIAIPGGFTAAKSLTVPIVLGDLGLEVADGVAAVAAGGTTIDFQRFNGANISVNAGQLYVRGQITLEVQ